MSCRQMHTFAEKWLHKYENDNTPGGELEELFPEECFGLGILMDCGESFTERYPTKAFHDPKVFESIIDEIDDPMFLATAIFSKWRGITHWWNEDLFAPAHRSWFVLAFKRLSTITQ